MTINGQKLFADLDAAIKEAKEQIEAAGCKEVHFYAHCIGYSWSKEGLNFKIEAVGDSTLVVKGRDLQQMVWEYIRRAQFDTQQKLLQLTDQTPKEEEKVDE